MKVKYTDYTPDSVVQTVIENFVKRAEMGEKKYGVTLDREDLTIEDFIESVLKNKSKDNDILKSKENEIVEVNPLIKRQIKSFKDTLESHGLSLDDVREYFKDNE